MTEKNTIAITEKGWVEGLPEDHLVVLMGYYTKGDERVDFIFHMHIKDNPYLQMQYKNGKGNILSNGVRVVNVLPNKNLYVKIVVDNGIFHIPIGSQEEALFQKNKVHLTRNLMGAVL